MAKPFSAIAARIKAKYDPLNSNTKSLLKFLAWVCVLLVLALSYHFNSSDNMDASKTFFEQRKDVSEYHEYKQDEENAKKRAEKNIFLQN